MKHFKVYEEYTEKDIEDLLSTLSSVGQVERTRVLCLMKGIVPQFQTHPSWWTDYLEVFVNTEFPDRGSEDANKRTALEKIKKGEFDQNLDSDRTAYIKSVGPEILKIFSKENIQRLAAKSPDLDSLVREIKKEAVNVIIRRWEEMHERFVSTGSEEEIQKFYDTEWRSSPKKLRETIEENIESSIEIKKEGQ